MVSCGSMLFLLRTRSFFALYDHLLHLARYALERKVTMDIAALDRKISKETLSSFIEEMKDERKWRAPYGAKHVSQKLESIFNKRDLLKEVSSSWKESIHSTGEGLSYTCYWHVLGIDLPKHQSIREVSSLGGKIASFFEIRPLENGGFCCSAYYLDFPYA